MIFSPTAPLKLTFNVSAIDGKSMNITFNNQGVYEHFTNLAQGEFVYETEITFPAEFEITLSGKGPGDTVIDSDGNIIKDKYIEILNIEVDRIPCVPHYVHQRVTLETEDGQEVTAAYWGFNGVVKLNFKEANSFFWALHSVD